jgi:hypothetical protein
LPHGLNLCALLLGCVIDAIAAHALAHALLIQATARTSLRVGVIAIQGRVSH